MNVKEKKRKLVEELYESLREKIFYKYNIVNRDKLKSYEEELVNLHDYLPNLISGSVIMSYTVLTELGVWDDIVEKSGKTRHYSREDNVVEFIEWIDAHKEFEELINRDEVKKLYDDVEQLEKQKALTINALT